MTSRDAVSILLEAEVLALTEGGTQRAVKLCEQVVSMSLKQWALQPAVMASPSHEALLALAQRVVEVRDGAALVHMFRTSATQSMTHMDVRHTLAVWRDRLPNKADSADVWDAILSWRTFVFNAVSEAAQVLRRSLSLVAFVCPCWGVMCSRRARTTLGTRCVTA